MEYITGEAVPQNKSNMRGLNNFIQDIRVCKDKEEEERRVNAEKANIRQKFSDGKTKMSGYDRKKYIAKLMYIFLLGYEVDFGHLEALKLLADAKFSRKQFGYLFLSLFLHESHEMVPLVIQSFLEDLKSSNEFYQAMALHAIGSISGRELAEAVHAPVEALAHSATTPLAVRKKALACLVTLFRKRPDVFALEQWPERLSKLLQAKSLSLVSSSLHLLLELAQKDPAMFSECQTPAIAVLHRMTTGKYEMDYHYYSVPAPWAQIVLMRYLMLYPPSPNVQADDALHSILAQILATPAAQKAKNQRTINHKNARNCVLFEAIKLVIHYDTSDKLLDQTMSLLGQMLKARQPNIRYLGLEAMSRLVASRDVQRVVRDHQQTVIDSLKETDVSIRKRALDLLYSMCDAESAQTIVRQLLDYLAKAEYEVRRELASKTAILAEKFSSNKAWYIDCMLELLRIAGEDVPDDMWHRVIRVVLSSSEDAQAYAARTCLRSLRDPQWNEILLNVAAYVLGEFGTLISEEPNSSPINQFEALHHLWPMVSDRTRAVLLNSYGKFSFLYGANTELVRKIQSVFSYYSASLDEELQQRAVEYLSLLRLPNQSVLEKVWDPMPAWTDDDQSLKPATEGTLIPGLDTPVAEQQVLNNGIVEPSNDILATHDGFYRQLWTSAEGFLYRDERLQIGLKSQQQGGVFHIMLYYGNTAAAPIEQLEATLPTLDYVQLAAKPLAPFIAPGQQASQLISAACVRPFVPSPVLQLSFSCGGVRFHVPVKLPVILTKFLVPTTLDAQQFFGMWKTFLPEQNQEFQAVFKTSAASVAAAFMGDVCRRFGFGVLVGVDPVADNVVAAASLQCSSSPSLPVLARLEGSPQALMTRLTIRSQNSEAATTIGRFIQSLLELKE